MRSKELIQIAIELFLGLSPLLIVRWALRCWCGGEEARQVFSIVFWTGALVTLLSYWAMSALGIASILFVCPGLRWALIVKAVCEFLLPGLGPWNGSGPDWLCYLGISLFNGLVVGLAFGLIARLRPGRKF